MTGIQENWRDQIAQGQTLLDAALDALCKGANDAVATAEVREARRPAPDLAAEFELEIERVTDASQVLATDLRLIADRWFDLARRDLEAAISKAEEAEKQARAEAVIAAGANGAKLVAVERELAAAIAKAEAAGGLDLAAVAEGKGAPLTRAETGLIERIRRKSAAPHAPLAALQAFEVRDWHSMPLVYFAASPVEGEAAVFNLGANGEFHITPAHWRFSEWSMGEIEISKDAWLDILTALEADQKEAVA